MWETFRKQIIFLMRLCLGDCSRTRRSVGDGCPLLKLLAASWLLRDPSNHPRSLPLLLMHWELIFPCRWDCYSFFGYQLPRRCASGSVTPRAAQSCPHATSEPCTRSRAIAFPGDSKEGCLEEGMESGRYPLWTQEGPGEGRDRLNPGSSSCVARPAAQRSR